MPILGLVAAVLVGLIALQIGGTTAEDPHSVTPPSREPARAASRAVVITDAGSARWTTEILARPVFSKGRRPAATASAAANLPKTLPRLAGVVLSPGGKFAIFAGTDGGKPVVAGEGDAIGPSVIEAIAAGQVTLRGPDGAIVLRPAFDGTSAPVSRPGPAIPVRAASQQLFLPFRPRPQAFSRK